MNNAETRTCVICEDNDNPATVSTGECSDYCKEAGERNEPETCEDRNYECCEKLSPEKHKQTFGY
jgi:hypothetical protein